MPEVELCIGECQSELFNRSQALNIAAKTATKDVFVIADADIIYTPPFLVQATQLLDKHVRIIPFSKFLDLSKLST
jgi:glycosyltransferase involved in cell wall biosynthesis